MMYWINWIKSFQIAVQEHQKLIARRAYGVGFALQRKASEHIST